MLLFEDERDFQIEMLIPASFAVFGVLSFVFHLRTLGMYKKNSIKNDRAVTELSFFIFNILFALGLIAIAIFFFSKFHEVLTKQIETEYWPFIIVIVLPIIIGVWLLLDARFLFNKTKKTEAQSFINQIDDIEGNG